MDIVHQFQQYLVEIGIAPKTIESKIGDAKGFAEYLATMGVVDIRELKRFYVTSYKNQLLEEKYAIATINKKINSLKAFNQFLIEKQMAKDLVVKLKKDRIKVAAGSEGESYLRTRNEELLFFVQDRSKVSLHNQLIVWLHLYTGDSIAPGSHQSDQGVRTLVAAAEQVSRQHVLTCRPASGKMAQGRSEHAS